MEEYVGGVKEIMMGGNGKVVMGGEWGEGVEMVGG